MVRHFFKRETAFWRCIKRLFDILGALAGMLVLGPVMLVGMLWVWLEEVGQLFFVKSA